MNEFVILFMAGILLLAALDLWIYLSDRKRF